MIKEPYKILTSFESVGSIGSLGVRIEVAGSNLPDLEVEAIQRVGYKAIQSVRDEITTAIMAADPEAQARAKAEREELIGCFDEPIYVEELPNGYCNEGCCRHLPWFVVTTKVGRIIIGWRKRVISIEWTDTRGTGYAQDLFPDENVTKGARSIHAWSVEDARRYVRAIIASGTDRKVVV